MKNTNIASFKSSIKDIFRYWLVFTLPMHNLTDSEIKFMSVVLYKRFRLAKEIQNEKYLNKALFDADTKLELAKEANITIERVNNLLSQLRKKKVIIINSVNPKYIPNIEQDVKNFRMIFNFDIND